MGAVTRRRRIAVAGAKALVAGAVVLGAAVVPAGVAHAAEYVGQYPSKAACEKEAEFRKNQDLASSYTCASNGNPASGDYASYALYRNL